MLAWGMNGADLPWLNGYPLRLVVPGYYGTYWMKHLNADHRARAAGEDVLDGYARIESPTTTAIASSPGTAPAKTKPIGRYKVRSFITSVAGGRAAAGRAAGRC